MITLSGLGKVDRERLADVIRSTKGTISVAETSKILDVTPSNASKMLSLWTRKGWLSRVRRGLYISIPLESRTAEIPLEDPWIVAARIFTPCYIGGWSAVEYWNLTEQIFRTVIVITTQRPRNRKPMINDTKFLLRTISDQQMFGLKPVWRGQIKVWVSDPTRTILDLLNDPQLGGGIRSTLDIFINYLKSDKNDLQLLVKYAKDFGNGAVFKRLGFLLEKFRPVNQKTINLCKTNITKGNAKLDPKLPAEKLVTRWKLWIPKSWSKVKTID